MPPRTIQAPPAHAPAHAHAQQHAHQHAHHAHAAHQHAHAHHQHGHAAPAPTPGVGALDAQGNVLMQVTQNADGGWGLSPYNPQGVGQPAQPETSLVTVVGVLGITSLALWWAWKKWGRPDDGERAREVVAERISGREDYGREDYRRLRSRRSRRRSREVHRAGESARPDARRSRRSKTRMIAEFKRFLDTDAESED